MLNIVIPSMEAYDETTEEFIVTKSQVLQLEHSLVSLSKWESRWHKPFLAKEALSDAETIDYIRCMSITQNVNPDVYRYITKDIIRKVMAYIEDPMTATTFKKDEKKVVNREIVTSEIIYYWMTTYNIPFECQKWHLNRLLTLINVCNIRNQPGKKMTRKETMLSNRTLNASRRAKLNSTG